MAAGIYNMTIEQGATFHKVFTVVDPVTGTPANYTGFTARMQIRREVDSTTAAIDLTTENGRITLGGVLGTVTLDLTAAETASLTRGGVYDIELISSAGVVERLLQGRVTLDPEVTR